MCKFVLFISKIKEWLLKSSPAPLKQRCARLRPRAVSRRYLRGAGTSRRPGQALTVSVFSVCNAHLVLL